MKIIFFTTCKPFVGDDAWRQEQAIKSWLLLKEVDKEIEIQIIIMGNDQGTKEICEKYNLIHEPNVLTFKNVPYVHSMFETASKYTDSNDVVVWTNADMIYFSDFVINIAVFKTFEKIKDFFTLVGQRHDWHNPKILNELNKKNFMSYFNISSTNTVNVINTDSNNFECSLHASCGIDYVVMTKNPLLQLLTILDKNLVIAGTRHDMIILNLALKTSFTCDITKTNFVIHQNHGYGSSDKVKLSYLASNNCRVPAVQSHIHETPFYTKFDNDKLKIVKR